MEPVFTLKNAPDKLKYKFKYLFGDLNYNDLLKIQMDETSTYSVSDYKTAKNISELIMSIRGINKKSTIVDGTSCVGGNVMSFARYFKHVFAIEFNESRLKLLKNNINVYKLNKKITAFNGDITVLYKELPIVDVYFLDPPWGGLDYLKSDKLDLYLSKINISDFCIMLKDYTKFIILKLPKNFNVENFSKTLDNQDKKSKHIELIKIHNLQKMMIVTIKVKNGKNYISDKKILEYLSVE